MSSSPSSKKQKRSSSSSSGPKAPPSREFIGDYKKELGPKVLIIGGDRGLGLELVKLLSSGGCHVYSTSRKSGSDEVKALKGATIVEGVDIAEDGSPAILSAQLDGVKVNSVFIVAGVFTTEGPLKDLDRAGERKMFEVCSIAPVFLVAKLLADKRLAEGARIGFITSEGGSSHLRTAKEGGANYGHHMSKAAANMGGRLMAYDLKEHGHPLVMIHPGFLRTDMTADKYKHLWDELNAVEASTAAPYIAACVGDVTLETTGTFVGAMGSFGIGLGEWALPLKHNYPKNIPPGGALPF